MSTAGSTYSPNELSRFLDSYLSNPEHSEQQIADRFKVSVETVRRWRAGEFWENLDLMKLTIRLLES